MNFFGTFRPNLAWQQRREAKEQRCYTFYVCDIRYIGRNRGAAPSEPQSDDIGCHKLLRVAKTASKPITLLMLAGDPRSFAFGGPDPP